MSAVCCVCLNDMCVPHQPWYAALRYSWEVWWVCGPCVDRVPWDCRTATNVQQDFEITFAKLGGESNPRGVYQRSSFKREEPEFWVAKADLLRFMPHADRLVDRLYPWCDWDHYLRSLADRVRRNNLESTKELLVTLTLFGSAIERFMFEIPAAKLQRKRYSQSEVKHLSKKQRRLAERLLEEILARY